MKGARLRTRRAEVTRGVSKQDNATTSKLETAPRSDVCPSARVLFVNEHQPLRRARFAFRHPDEHYALTPRAFRKRAMQLAVEAGKSGLLALKRIENEFAGSQSAVYWRR